MGAGGEGDLVITDVVMPDENGLDLIPRIRKIRPDLRVIVMSAQITLLTAVQAQPRGAHSITFPSLSISMNCVGRRAGAVGAGRRRCRAAAQRPEEASACR